MRDFDHIGLPTDVKRPNEMWVESTRVWVTSPTDSPDMIEYLRYEPDSPVTGPLREKPHVAFRVEDLEWEIEGRKRDPGPVRRQRESAGRLHLQGRSGVRVHAEQGRQGLAQRRLKVTGAR